MASSVRSELGACVSRARSKLAMSDGSITFTLHNVPKWPKGRVQAWIRRQRIDVKAVDKDDEWTHAVVTVASLEGKAKAMADLDGRRLQAAILLCSEVHQNPKEAAPPAKAVVVAEVLPEEAAPGSLIPSGVMDRTVLQSSGCVVKKRTRSDFEGAMPDLRDQLTSLWRLPYPTQLRVKYASCVTALDGLTWALAHRVADVPKPHWLQVAMKGPPGRAVCCPIEGIVRSPQNQNYRNNSEFTIGKDEKGLPQVGFLYGRFVDGFSEVGSAEDLPNLSELSKQYAETMTAFLRSESSKLPVWDKTRPGAARERGFWRSLTVREGRASTYFPPPSPNLDVDEPLTFANLNLATYTVPLTSAAAPEHTAAALAVAAAPTEEAEFLPNWTVVVVQVNPEFTTAEEMRMELIAWGKFMRNNVPEGTPDPFVMAVQHNALGGNGAPAGATLEDAPGGDARPLTFCDTLCGIRFYLHPTSFFQVNSAAAACVYKLAGDWAAPDSATLILDLFCGCGSFGVSLAARAKAVVGIDSDKESIKSAIQTVKLNGIDNCHFMAGMVEHELAQVLRSERVTAAREVVAIVDPPRAGLQKGAINAILGHPQIHRLVYVSCNPETLKSNVVDLAMPCRAVRRPHRAPGKTPFRPVKEPPRKYTPFVPIKCMAVDLFPHTPHVECVMLLERANKV